MAYLNSGSWRTRRNRALQLAGWRCARCSAKRDLQVHHKTYERLGREWDQDLEVICANCHEGEHIDQASETETGRVYLRLASEALRQEPFNTVADLSDAVKFLCAAHKIPYDRWQVDRALELIIGTRLKRVDKRRPDEPPPDPAVINRQDAHELLRRLFGHNDLVKSMPTTSPEAALAHEEKVRQQAAEFRLITPREKRRPLLARLEDIFSSRSR